MKGAGPLLDDDLLAGLRVQAVVDTGRLRAFQQGLHGDLQVPQAGVGSRPRGVLVGGGGEDDGNALLARRRQQGLGGGDDLLHVVAGEGVVRPGPGVGHVNDQQRGTGTVADAALEAATPVELGVRREDGLQGRLDLG